MDNNTMIPIFWLSYFTFWCGLM